MCVVVCQKNLVSFHFNSVCVCAGVCVQYVWNPQAFANGISNFAMFVLSTLFKMNASMCVWVGCV